MSTRGFLLFFVLGTILVILPTNIRGSDNVFDDCFRIYIVLFLHSNICCIYHYHCLGETVVTRSPMFLWIINNNYVSTIFKDSLSQPLNMWDPFGISDVIRQAVMRSYDTFCCKIKRNIPLLFSPVKTWWVSKKLKIYILWPTFSQRKGFQLPLCSLDTCIFF